MNKRVVVYLFIAILLLFSIYLIINEPEKVAIQNSTKSTLQNKKYIQNEDIRIEYITTNKDKISTKIETSTKNNIYSRKEKFHTLENTKKAELTAKQQELKKRYEINQQMYISKARYNHIKEKNTKHQEFLELRANYIKQANQNIKNIPDIKQKLAYENIQNRNKMQIIMINRDIK